MLIPYFFGHPINRCWSLLAWRVGIWGDGLELCSVDADSLRLLPGDSGSLV
jgi:hypothetical protein